MDQQARPHRSLCILKPALESLPTDAPRDSADRISALVNSVEIQCRPEFSKTSTDEGCCWGAKTFWHNLFGPIGLRPAPLSPPSSLLSITRSSATTWRVPVSLRRSHVRERYVRGPGATAWVPTAPRVFSLRTLRFSGEQERLVNGGVAPGLPGETLSDQFRYILIFL